MGHSGAWAGSPSWTPARAKRESARNRGEVNIRTAHYSGGLAREGLPRIARIDKFRVPILTNPSVAGSRAAPPFLEHGARWFLSSGIQETGGGVARYFLAEAGRNARISTEITGYAASALLELHGRGGGERLREAGLKAAGFLLRAWQVDIAAMPFEWAANGDVPENHTYFFDCGIIARGLLRAWRETAEHKYLQGAYNCGEAMLRDFVNGADIDPILALPGKEPLPREPRWSRSSACYQAKPALAWLELADVTRDDRFRQAFETTLARSLADHLSFAEQAGTRAQVMDRLHAYSYFLEALLAVAERPEVAAALGAGIAQTAALLRAIGPEFVRADVCAQLLRVRLYAHGLDAVVLDEAAAAEEARWTASFQITSDDPRFDGGFWFGRREGIVAPFVNPVSAAFSLQALAQWHDAQAGAFPTNWHDLI